MIVAWAKQICRLFSVMDAMYVVGNFLYKRSLRYTIASATVALVGYLGNIIPGVETYPAKVALLLPLCVGGTTITLGLLLKVIPSLIQSRLVTVAQAADLDLMENYRKWRREHHLASLWERVYRFEWRLRTHVCRVHPHPEECPPEVCDTTPDASTDEQTGRDQFLRRARFALDRDQPEPRQRYYLGLDLRYVEDWYNGAYFDPSDRKLMEQFAAASTLVKVREAAGYRGTTSLADLPLALFGRFWFAMLCRAVEMQIGEAVECLNRQFHTDAFNAQAILWPGEEDEAWIAQFGPSAKPAVLYHRRRLLWRIFGDNDTEMFRIVDRFVWPQLVLASTLRAMYDPEYLDGSLGYDVFADLADGPLSDAKKRSFETLKYRVEEDRPRLNACLQHEVFTRVTPHPLEDDEAYRALRIAVHTNQRGLRTMLGKFSAKPHRRTELALAMLPAVEFAVSHRRMFTNRLLALRVHHELARIQRNEYRQLLSDLLASCRDVDPLV
ncbi:MAG: hypothetical protein D6741_06090, partial [Planctomycetota bacterium]